MEEAKKKIIEIEVPKITIIGEDELKQINNGERKQK